MPGKARQATPRCGNMSLAPSLAHSSNIGKAILHWNRDRPSCLGQYSGMRTTLMSSLRVSSSCRQNAALSYVPQPTTDYRPATTQMFGSNADVRSPREHHGFHTQPCGCYHGDGAGSHRGLVPTPEMVVVSPCPVSSRASALVLRVSCDIPFRVGRLDLIHGTSGVCAALRLKGLGFMYPPPPPALQTMARVGFGGHPRWTKARNPGFRAS